MDLLKEMWGSLGTIVCYVLPEFILLEIGERVCRGLGSRERRQWIGGEEAGLSKQGYQEPKKNKLQNIY